MNVRKCSTGKDVKGNGDKNGTNGITFLCEGMLFSLRVAALNFSLIHSEVNRQSKSVKYSYFFSLLLCSSISLTSMLLSITDFMLEKNESRSIQFVKVNA